MRNLTTVLAFILIALASCSYTGDPPVNPIRVNPEGVALDGYSPVSYFTKGVPEPGLKEFTIRHEGIAYWLTSTEQMETFLSEPERFVPAHGGWCTLMMAGSGRRTPGHPESFAIVDDRLMLFWSGDTLETAGMGMQNWLGKTRGDTTRAMREVANADNKWLRFLQGKRQAPIYLYKPSDQEGINADQLQAARIAY